MIIATPTITHTGTRFLHRRVFHAPDRYRVFSPNRIAKGCTEIVYHTHMFNQLRHVWQMYLDNGYPIIIPLVHPARNWESMQRRGHLWLKFESQWMNMLQLAEQCEPYYLHLDDSTVREEQAERICNFLNLPSVADWSASKTTGATHGTHALELTRADVVKIPDELINFYEQTKREVL